MTEYLTEVFCGTVWYVCTPFQLTTQTIILVEDADSGKVPYIVKLTHDKSIFLNSLEIFYNAFHNVVLRAAMHSKAPVPWRIG